MIRRTVPLLALLALAACQSPPPKQAPAAESAKAPVAAAAPNAAPATSSRSASSAPTGVRDPLNDPNGVLAKRSVYFEYDQDAIRGDDRPVVENHGRYLASHAQAKVTVQGNTDERGSREYNIALGQRRADAVRRAMHLLGASDAQVDTVSFGREKPRCTQSDESCWSQNRRADLVYK